MGKKMIERYDGIIVDGQGDIIDRKYGRSIIKFSFMSSEGELAEKIWKKCMELLEEL